MLTSNHRGRGNDPVVVLGSMRFEVAVNIASTNIVGLLRRDRDHPQRAARPVDNL